MDGQIILYNGPNSPFGRKTKVTAIVQEVKIEEKIIDVYKADFLDKYKLKQISLSDYRELFVFPVKDYYTKLGFNFTEDPFESAGVDFIKIYHLL